MSLCKARDTYFDVMKIYESYIDIDPADQGHVVAIGNFDGVHIGHQKLISIAAEKAKELGCKLGVMTFNPHPRHFFQTQKEPFLLTNEAQKRNLLERLCNVDTLYNIPFTKEFSSLPADQFIEDVLIKGLNVKHIVVGHDFCFGAKRSGDTTTLKEDKRFETTIVDVISHDNGTIYSSSEIRHALRRADIETANSLLGWEWYIEGEVIHGDKRGRELGYPTANMKLGNYLCPAHGVYAVKVQLEGGDKWRGGATNIGIRPMFESKEPLIETFIFDFDSEIYGQKLKVKPVSFLRGEAKFDSLEALIAQIDKDCAQARELIDF